MSAPTYITAARVAQITGYTVDTVRAKFADGSLPAHRLGGTGHWRAVESEIRAAVEGKPIHKANGVDIRAALRSSMDKAAVRVVRRQAREGR